MSAPLGCPRCGYQNTPGYQFCVNCGAPLAAPGPSAPYLPPSAGPYVVPPGYTPYGAPVDYDRTKRIDRTKTGILLLLIGSLVSWVPDVGFVGIVILLIGAIFVILGRKAFGPTHTRNVLISVILFIVGLAVVLGVAVVAALSNIGSIVGPGGTVSPTPPFLAAAANAGLLAAIVAAAVLGIAEVLFTYALQAQPGRILLWAAYGANLALAIALYLILRPIFGAVVTLSDYEAAVAAQGTYALLAVVPSLCFAGADYLVWSRINRGEIPAAAPAGPGLPPAPPSPPPMPPQAPPSGPAPPMNPR